MGKKRFFNFKNLFFVSFLAVAGIFSAGAYITHKQVEETPVVEKAEAASSATIYCAYGGTDGMCYQTNSHNGWVTNSMSQTSETWNGMKVFSATIDDGQGSLGALKFYHGAKESWQDVITIWGDWDLKQKSYYNGKLFIYRTDAAGGPYDKVVDASRTLYYAVSRLNDSTDYPCVESGYTVKVNYNRSWVSSSGDWKQATMNATANTLDGLTIYSCTLTSVTAVDTLQFQIYDGSTQKYSQNAITSFKYLTDSDYSGKIYSQGSTSWVTYSTDTKIAAADTIYWTWTSDTWTIDPHIRYCVGGVWSSAYRMTGSKDAKNGTAYYEIPVNTTAVRFYHGSANYGRTARITFTSGSSGLYNKFTTNGISAESFPAVSQGYEYEGGLTAGQGVYVTPCSDWTSYISDSVGIYVYFFFDEMCAAWTSKLTAVPGASNLYEAEVPGNDYDIAWNGAIVILHTGPNFTDLDPANQTVDIRYSTSDSSKSHITVSNSYGDYSHRTYSISSDYTDTTRANFWGSRFIGESGVTCDNGKTRPWASSWTGMKSEYNPMSSAAKNLVKTAVASESGTDLQKAVARYDYIIHKYGTDPYTDYANRTDKANGGAYSYGAITTYKPFELIMGSSEDTLSVIIIVIASSVALLSITSLSVLLVKKRKSKEE